MVLVLMCFSCKEKTFQLSATPQTIEMEETETSDTIAIHGSDGNCELEYSPDWITCQLTDSILVFNASANEGKEAREDAIVVKCGASRISIPVSQYAKATKLELPNGAKVTIPITGGSQELVVLSDGHVNIDSVTSPLEASWKDNKLTLSAPENTGSRQTIKLKLTAGDFTEDITVVLEGKVCSTCNGTGKITCKRCGGQGSYWSDTEFGMLGCRSCGGRGYSYRVPDPDYRDGTGKVTCPTCKGSGI